MSAVKDDIAALRARAAQAAEAKRPVEDAPPDWAHDEPPPEAPPMGSDDEPPPEVYEQEPAAHTGPIALDDFYAYAPTHTYIFRPTREMWGGAAINARLPAIKIGKAKVPPTVWLDQHRPVEQMTWSPGEPEIIEDRIVDNGGWIARPGLRVFNQYRAPRPEPGDPGEAGPWLAHLHRLYPEDEQHIIRWLAQRVQRPGEKINHALVLGGAPGIGKDSLLQPVIQAVGVWNCHEIAPGQLMGQFNGYRKSVILRISEARDQGDAGGNKVDRYGLYEHCKVLLAAPPDVLRTNEKHLREYAILNVVGVVFTTNYSDGLYLPADDRRHFVAWTDLERGEFGADYWRDLFFWYQKEGGYGHVAAYLAGVDLSAFDAKAPPPKTAGFHRMVESGRAPEDAELADALDALGHPDALTIATIAGYASADFRAWLLDRRNSRQVPHRMEAAGYVSVPNEGAQSGLWVVGGRRQVIYCRRELSIRERFAAAAELVRESRGGT